MVQFIIQQTGQRANLIAITCQELLKQLPPGRRIFDSELVEHALLSDEIEKAMQAWRNLTDDKKQCQLDKIIVYATAEMEQFTPDMRNFGIKEIFPTFYRSKSENCIRSQK